MSYERLRLAASKAASRQRQQTRKSASWSDALRNFQLQKWPPALIATVVVLALAAFVLVAMLDTGSSDDRISLVVMAEQCVENKLLSPSTASFPWPSEIHIIRIDDGWFRVSGYVDAQNLFGVPLRQNWVAEILPLENDRFRHRNVVIYPR